jgi:hypothetical protein
VIRDGGIRAQVTFDPFSMAPSKAWEQAKKAAKAAFELYGFDVIIVEHRPSFEDAQQRWEEWRRNRGIPEGE